MQVVENIRRRWGTGWDGVRLSFARSIISLFYLSRPDGRNSGGVLISGTNIKTLSTNEVQAFWSGLTCLNSPGYWRLRTLYSPSSPSAAAAAWVLTWLLSLAIKFEVRFKRWNNAIVQGGERNLTLSTLLTLIRFFKAYRLDRELCRGCTLFCGFVARVLKYGA